MTRRWLRLDAQWDDTEWVMLLGPLSQLAWIKLLCYVKLAGRRGSAYALKPKAAAKKWGVPVRAVEDMIFQAVQDGALKCEDEGEKWVVTKWAYYQEPDVTNAARQQRYRAKSNGSNGVTERDPVARDHRPPTTDRETATDAIASEGEQTPTMVEKSEVGRECLAGEQRRDNPDGVIKPEGIAPEAPAPSPTIGDVMGVVRRELHLGKDDDEMKRSGSIVKEYARKGVRAQDLIDACRGTRKLIELGLVDNARPGQPVGLRFLRTWKYDSRFLWDAAIDHERFGQASAPTTNARGRAAPLRVAVALDTDTRKAG